LVYEVTTMKNLLMFTSLLALSGLLVGCQAPAPGGAPSAPADAAAAAYDPSEDLRVTRTSVLVGGRTEVDENRTATLINTSSGTQFNVRQGETMEVNGEEFVVTSITARNVTLQARGSRRDYVLSALTDNEAP
jgi:hypothetical protein